MADAASHISMIEIHRDAMASSNVAYNNFLLFYGTGKRMVYGFVEGVTDPSFYRNFIETILPDGWECKLIPAGNKEKVLALFDYMDWNRFPRKAICFFVDRDLSDFLGGEKCQGDNLFVSDSYSIESELLTENTLERTLDELCKIGALQPNEWQKLKDMFRSNLAIFKESLACIMAQIILWRRAQCKGDDTISRLDKIKVKDFFEFSSGKIEIKQDFSLSASRVQHAAQAVNAPFASVEELREAELEFREKAGIEKFVRGKYLITFFLECTEALRLAIPVLFQRHPEPPGIKAPVGGANAIQFIGPRARCPASLRAFLDRNYVAHINPIVATGP